MKTKLYLSFLALTTLPLSISSVQAQTYQPSNRTPIGDNTLGTQVSGNGSNFNITGGVRKGQTVFHSFNDFSVPTNGSANFLNPVGNRDIITRVTGNLFSDINGTVNTNGANFFLINPNGIVFGPNAQLNVGKAFVGSTASSLDLVDGGGRTITFGTNPNGDAPLLAVNPNVLFNVSRLNLGGGTGAISNFGTLQTPNDSQYIGLIGGNVTLNGGKINAPDGRVELGGLSVAGSVGLSTDGNNLKAQFPTNVARGNVSLTQSIINVIGTGKGDVTITARNIDLLSGSVLSGIGEGLGTPETVGGDIKLNATGKIAIVGSSSLSSIISNRVSSNAIGQGGNLTIDADSLLLQDGAAIGTATFGQGNAGNISIKTTGDLTINGNNKTTGITSSTGGQGDAGKITIDAQGDILLANSGVMFAAIAPGATGNSQGISITTRNLNLSNTTYISSDNFGKGNAGNIDIKATGNITMSGTNDRSLLQGDSTTSLSRISTSTSGEGNAGKITIDTKGSISLANRSIIDAAVNNQGTGDSQGISINAGSLNLTEFSRILSLNDGGKGNAGNIDIKTTGNITITGTNNQALLQGDETIVLSDITAASFGNGNSGKVLINTKGKISLSNRGGIFSSIARGGDGNSQGISIDSKNLFLTNLSQISSSNRGLKGTAGDIKITNTNDINISNLSYIFSDNFGQGKAANIIISSDRMTLNKSGITAESIATDGVNGGNIDITLKDKLILRNNACISTNCQSRLQNANGGNITINSPLIVALPGNSNITANATGGKGGNINITSQGLFGIQYRPNGQNSPLTNDITASSTFGQNGNVNISTPGTDPGKDSTELPNVTTDASNQISQVCSANNRQNKLTVAGRGGLPPTANDLLTSDVIWQDARAVSRQPAVSIATTHRVELAPPAVGWIFNGKKVILVAAKTNRQQTGTNVACANIK